MSSINVLDRVAEGLLMSDEARTLLGFASPVQFLFVFRDEMVAPRKSSSKISASITGCLGPTIRTTALPDRHLRSCSSNTEFKVFAEAVRALGGLLM